MAQQTAVDYLVKLYYTEYDILLPSEDYAQAKQMEKEQIITAHLNGQAEFDKEEYRLEVIINAGKYYNEVYGGQGSPDTSPNTQNK